MKEYKVTINLRDQSGLLPDFFGKTVSTYMKGESAQEIQEKIDKEMEEKYDYEMKFEGIHYSVDIKEV